MELRNYSAFKSLSLPIETQPSFKFAGSGLPVDFLCWNLPVDFLGWNLPYYFAETLIPGFGSVLFEELIHYLCSFVELF